MQQLIKQIEREFDLQESTILALSSPLVKYALLLSFWSVLWADSVSDCMILLIVLFVIAAFGRTVNKVSIFLSLILVIVIVGDVVLTLHAQNNLTSQNVIFALQIIILFGSPIILFGNSTVMQHFYFWSNILGGSSGGAIIGFGRTMCSLSDLIADTRDAYKNKGISPLRNLVPFLVSLQASIFHFARTYADAMEIKNVINIRGEGSLAEGISHIDVLMLIVAVLMPLLVVSV